MQVNIDWLQTSLIESVSQSCVLIMFIWFSRSTGILVTFSASSSFSRSHLLEHCLRLCLVYQVPNWTFPIYGSSVYLLASKFVIFGFSIKIKDCDLWILLQCLDWSILETVHSEKLFCQKGNWNFMINLLCYTHEWSVSWGRFT